MDVVLKIFFRVKLISIFKKLSMRALDIYDIKEAPITSSINCKGFKKKYK